jgi:hypothetical protein
MIYDQKQTRNQQSERQTDGSVSADRTRPGTGTIEDKWQLESGSQVGDAEAKAAGRLAETMSAGK